jgi:hypothetical protein
VEWKPFYEAERARLGKGALCAMLERAPRLEGRAVIFPHTRLEVTGDQVAAAVRFAVESGSEEVLAIGVLHKTMAEEFSLDAFDALLALSKKPALRVHRRFPVAADESLDELARRMPIVATCDPLHQGVGYGDSPDVARAAADSHDFARASIETQLRALAAHDFDAFAAECARVRSDFKRSGPVFARALGRGFSFEVRALELVDYAHALGAPSPTWVAGALIAIQ